MLVLVHLLLLLAEEADVDVDVLVGLELALHGSDGEDLSGAGLLHLEVKADGVLALILQIQGKFFGLTNAHWTKVKLSLDCLIKGDLECFSIDLNLLLLLLDAVVLNIFHLKLDGLKELLLLDGIEFDLNNFALAWLQSATCPSEEVRLALVSAVHNRGLSNNIGL